jgi:hypothetical protein
MKMNILDGWFYMELVDSFDVLYDRYANPWARSALELARGRDVEYAAAFALALSGDSAGSQRLG